MSQESVERFLGRIITDNAFRKMAMGSMRLAMAADSLEFTQEEMDALMAIDWDTIELASSEIGMTIKRSSASSVLSMSAENETVIAVALPPVGAIR